MIAPMVNSATAEALRPGALTMRTPRSRAAARSMLTGPPRATTISLSAGMRLSIAAENGASWVIAISAAPTKPTIVSASPWYSLRPSIPGSA